MAIVAFAQKQINQPEGTCALFQRDMGRMLKMGVSDEFNSIFSQGMRWTCSLRWHKGKDKEQLTPKHHVTTRCLRSHSRTPVTSLSVCAQLDSSDVMIEAAHKDVDDRTSPGKLKGVDGRNVTVSSKGDAHRDECSNASSDSDDMTHRRWERTDDFRLPLDEAGPFEFSEGKWLNSDASRFLDVTHESLTRRRSSGSQMTVGGASLPLTEENRGAISRSDSSSSGTPEPSPVAGERLVFHYKVNPVHAADHGPLAPPRNVTPKAEKKKVAPPLICRPTVVVFDTTDEAESEKNRSGGSSTLKKIDLDHSPAEKVATPAYDPPKDSTLRAEYSTDCHEELVSVSMLNNPGTRAVPSPDTVVELAAGLSVVTPGKGYSSPPGKEPLNSGYDAKESHNMAARKLRTIPMRLFIANLFVSFILVAVLHYELLAVFAKRKEQRVPVGRGITLRERPVCRSVHCRAVGTHLFYTLNMSARPCDSIYDLVCRPWVFEPPARYRQVVLGAERLFIDNIYAEIKRILESRTVEVPATTGDDKLGQLYRLCTDVNGRLRNGLAGFRKLMQRYGLETWPYQMHHSEVPQGVALFVHDTGSHAFFRLSITADGLRPGVLTAECPWLGLPAPSFTEKTNDIRVYRIYIVNVLRELSSPSTAVESLATQIIGFETMLAHMVVQYCPTRRPYSKLDMPVFWEKFVKKAVTLHSRLLRHTIRVQSPQYMSNITNILLEGSAALVSYFGWSVAASLLPATEARFTMLHQRLRRELGLEPLPLDRQCIKDANEVMPLAVGRVYILAYPRKASGLRAYRMGLQLLRSLDQEVVRDRWFDDETRGMYAHLRAKMNTMFGYSSSLDSEIFLDARYGSVNVSQSYVEAYVSAASATFQSSFDSKLSAAMCGRDRFLLPDDVLMWMRHRSPRPFYDVLVNSIVVPSGVLHPPYYDDAAEAAALNFGGLGFLIAYDLLEQLLSNRTETFWGRLVARTTVAARLRCLETRLTTDVPNVPVQNTALTLLAARLAFQAYQQSRGFIDDAAMSGIEEMSPDQLFFVALARTLCSVARTEHYTNIVMQNTMVTDLAQIDPVLLWLPEFVDAFNCTVPASRHDVTLKNVTKDCE